MRGGAHVKEALGVVTLLWNHPILTGLLLLIFTPPFFPLVVYFSPLLMSTGLCVVALVSVGSQMEKIKAEGGPGQLENHLGREQGVSRWVPRENRPGGESMELHHYGQRENHRSLYASSGININVVPVPPSWTGGNSGHDLATTRAIAQLRPEPVQNHPPTPLAEESEEDWWDNWVKEYESRPGWGEEEDQSLPAPAIRTSSTALEVVSQAPAPATIPTAVLARSDRHQDAPPMTPRKPVRQETRGEKPPPVPVSASVVAAPVAAAPVAALVAAPVSVTVVNRQEVSRSLPPPPTTSTSRTSQEEIVVSVKESDLRPHVSLAPIRTGREKRDFRQVDRVHSKLPAAQASDIQEVPPPRSVDVERVSDVQALQSIEKLLQMEMGASNMATPTTSLSRNVADVKNAGLGNSSGSKPQVSVAREAVSPQLSIAMRSGSVVSTGKGIAVEASEKNRNKITVGAAAPGSPAEDMIAGETPLLRHLKTSRSEKQVRSAAYTPLPVRSSRGLMSEKVLPPPQFSPRVLHSLQPLPPKGFSPRLPNLSTVPLGNPVEKIPQWVYDGIPKERSQRTESQNVKQAETAEEKHVRAFEQAVKVLSYTRRRKHARRPAPIQVDSAALQARWDANTPSSTPAETTPASTRQERTPEQTPSRVSPHRPGSRASSPQRASPGKSVVAENLPARISEDVAEERGHGAAHQSTSQDSIEMAPATLPTPRASAAFSPRISPSAVVAASPQKATIAASPRRASRAASPQPTSIAASPRRASRAASPQPASIAASPRPASPQPASTAASPRPSSPQPASIAAPPRPASPQPASIAASPRPASPQPASIAASPRPASPQSASIGASPRPASVASSPRKASSSVAASPRRASRASSPGHKPSIVSSAPWPASVASSSQKPALIAASPQQASSPRRASIAASPRPPSRAPSAASSPHRSSDRQSSSSTTHSRRRRHISKHCMDKVAFRRIEGSTYYDPPSAAEREKKLLKLEDYSPSEDYIPIEQEVTADPPSVEVKEAKLPADSNCVTPPSASEGAALRWGRSYSAARKSRRRLEPRRVVTIQDTDMFSLKKSFSTRNGETKKFVDSSSDDERESVTPRASTRSMGRTIKPLVWRSRSVQAREDSD